MQELGRWFQAELLAERREPPEGGSKKKRRHGTDAAESGCREGDVTNFGDALRIEQSILWVTVFSSVSVP